MARRKTLPESVRAKLALAERLAALRSELYGDRGGPEMARRLGIPVRTWYNYEGGVTVPAEVILKIIELTSVEAVWLLHGEGPKFRNARPERLAGRRNLVGDNRRSAQNGPSAPGGKERAKLAGGRRRQPPTAPMRSTGSRGEPELPAPGVDHRAFRELTNTSSVSDATAVLGRRWLSS